MLDEQYFLVTRGKGFTWLDTEAMSVGERQYFCKKLVEEIKAQNKAVKDADAEAQAAIRRRR